MLWLIFWAENLLHVILPPQGRSVSQKWRFCAISPKDQRKHAMIASYGRQVFEENPMGEAKRRKAALGDKYGQEQPILSWLPLTKSQAEQAYKLTTKGAWIGIGSLVVVWAVIRFIGPAFGWWNVQ